MARRTRWMTLRSAPLRPSNCSRHLTGPSRSRLRAALRMAAIGVRRTWPLLIAVRLGMLAAVTLICTAPVNTALSSEVQLQHTLAAVLADTNTECH
jgi:hypothetical protein